MSAAVADAPAASTYQLLIHLTAEATIQIGRLGCFTFPAGYYCYTGSAKRNLAARVRRHCATDKRLRWHVDYLLAAVGARVVATRVTPIEECAANAALPGEVLVPGFGSSDCRAACGSHLKYWGTAPGATSSPWQPV